VSRKDEVSVKLGLAIELEIVRQRADPVFSIRPLVIRGWLRGSPRVLAVARAYGGDAIGSRDTLLAGAAIAWPDNEVRPQRCVRACAVPKT
jgi:hypothetical protein